MNISDLLTPSLVLCRHTASSKKRVLEEISDCISQHHTLESHAIFSALVMREKLGSTGIGEGIAIPHCRIPQCKETMAMLVTLDKGIDFDAIDNELVDIIFVLLVPEDTNDNHLKTLSTIAECLSDSTRLKSIRNATNRSELIAAITQ